jgi:hypothetical protein
VSAPYAGGLIQLFKDIVDIALLRATPGGQDISSETLLILARVTFEDYELFPGPEK